MVTCRPRRPLPWPRRASKRGRDRGRRGHLAGFGRERSERRARRPGYRDRRNSQSRVADPGAAVAPLAVSALESATCAAHVPACAPCASAPNHVRGTSATMSPAVRRVREEEPIPDGPPPSVPARTPTVSTRASREKGLASDSGAKPKSDPGVSSGRPRAPNIRGALRLIRIGGLTWDGSAVAKIASEGA